jgi:NADP-dependent 3-hydroxy acid dehydrogenase YdfG
MNTLKDKTIVLIGATGGIGQAVVEKLSKRGANLALAGRKIDALNSLAERARAAGAGTVLSESIDVIDEDSVASFYKSVQDKFGHADVLLYMPGMSIASPVTDMALADYDQIIDVNLKGLFLAAKYYIPITLPERNPILSFISSQAATRANPNAPVYCTAKAAVSMLGQGLALQTLDKNIRVTAFKPGPVSTKGFWGDRPVPHEKFMQASDVAEVIDFVFSLPPHVVMHEVSFESFTFLKK